MEDQRDLGIAKLYFRAQQIPQSLTTVAINDSIENNNWYFSNILRETIPIEDLNANIHEIKWDSAPWTRKPPNICAELGIKKNDTNRTECVQIAIEHATTHLPGTWIYTDGSKSSDGVGCTAIIPQLNLSESLSLPNNSSIFTAELHASLLALNIS